MTPQEIVQGITDAVAIVASVAEANPAAGLQPALDLLEKILLELPPLDAPALDPADRAAADAEAKALEDAKFGKVD